MRQLDLKRAEARPKPKYAPQHFSRMPREREEDGPVFSRHSALPSLTVVPRAPPLSDVHTDNIMLAALQATPKRHLLAPTETRRPTLLSDSRPSNPRNIPPPAARPGNPVPTSKPVVRLNSPLWPTPPDRPRNPACPVRQRPCHPVGISESDGSAVWPSQPGCRPSKSHLVQKELDLAGVPAREVRPNPLVHRVPLLTRRAEMNQPEVVPVREKAPPRLFPAIAKGNVSLVKAKKRKKGKKAKTTSLGPSGVVYERRFMLE